jgi:hypothetical protein
MNAQSIHGSVLAQVGKECGMGTADRTVLQNNSHALRVQPFDLRSPQQQWRIWRMVAQLS